MNYFNDKSLNSVQVKKRLRTLGSFDIVINLRLVFMFYLHINRQTSLQTTLTRLIICQNVHQGKNLCYRNVENYQKIFFYDFHFSMLFFFSLY